MADFNTREQAAYDRVVGLFAAVDPGLPVGDGSWTARDVLAHLCNVARRYTSAPRLGETVREVDAINAEELGALDGLSMDELLGKFERAFSRYREVWTEVGPEHMWPFHGGGQLPTASLRANWLGEMLVHGHDVAAAAGHAWEITDADAADLLTLLRGIAPTYGRAGDPVAVEIAVDGASPWVLAVGEDGISTSEPPADVSARLTGRGAGAVLLFYQRVDVDGAEPLGLQVSGDPAAVGRLISHLEKP